MIFTEDSYSFISWFLPAIKSIFDITIPGTNISFFQLFIAIIITTFVIKLFMTFIEGGIGIFGEIPELYNKERYERQRSIKKLKDK